MTHFSSPFVNSPTVRARVDAQCTSAATLGDERELDQKSGVEYLQIRRRWLDRANTVPALQALDGAGRNIHFDRSDDRQLDVVIYRFVMVEGDLGAFASGILLGRRFFRFAMAVRRAAALRPSEHKILFAGDAPTPDQRREEEQGKKRTGEGSAQHSI
jgi:hypothetical protein